MYRIDFYMYFRVKDAEMFGGVGSTGYFHHAYLDIYPLRNTHEEFEDVVLRTMEAHAGELGVDVSKIEQITREEYKANGGELIKEENYYLEDNDTESEE